MKAKRNFILLVLIGALILSIFSFLKDSYSEDLEIYEKTLRLHIPANSDSEEDQNLKLQVRDAVIELMTVPLSHCSDKESAVECAKEMEKEIKRTADKVIAKSGKNYTAKVSIKEEYYPKRDYEGISLPAGKYTSLIIELGTGEGHNWWCVLFPQVCTSTAEPQEVLAEVGFTAEQIRLLTEREDTEYVVKFKIVEIIKEIFG